MIRLSRSQEREERRGMGRGLRASVIALCLCWLPVVGLLLAAIGFIRVAGRVTQAYKTRRAVYLAVSLAVLIVCSGALAAEAYVYTHDPYLVADVRDWVLDKVTGGNYYGGYYDDTYQQYTDQFYSNPGAYTYPEDYANTPSEGETQP